MIPKASPEKAESYCKHCKVAWRIPSVSCVSKADPKSISANYTNTLKILLADSIDNLQITLKIIKLISSL